MVDGSISSNKTDMAEQLRQSAREYVQAKRWAEARSAYAALLSNDKEDEDALTGLAGALEKLADYEAMYEAAQDAVQANPGSARALAYKARALQKLERLSEATIANDQALLLDTNLALAWFNRSGQQLLQGHYPEALRYALHAIELDPTDPRAWANKGLALYSLNRSMEALEAINFSLSLDPDYVIAL